MIIKLCQIIWTFAQIGLVSFGGPAASIAIMQRTIVDRRKWVTQSEFLDFVAVSHMIPGPIAVQLSLHLGYRRGGLLGALAAVFGFVVPAAFITWAVAVFYQRSHALPALEACLAGVRPAVLAVILISLWDIAGRLTWNKWRFVLLAVVVGLNLLGIDAIVIMAFTLAYSAFYLSVTARKSRGQGKAVETNSEKDQPPAQGPNLFGIFLPTAAAFSKASLVGKSLYLFGMFFKIGLLLYGGGNVVAAYIQSDFVDRGLLTQAQFLDALAIGQSTPGPILTVATFVGYMLAGHLGAIAATLGIITPCVILASLVHPWVVMARSSEKIATFLNVINLVVIGLILSVCLNLGIWVFQDLKAIGFAVVAGVLLWFKVPPVVVVIAAGLAGWLF